MGQLLALVARLHAELLAVKAKLPTTFLSSSSREEPLTIKATTLAGRQLSCEASPEDGLPALRAAFAALLGQHADQVQLARGTELLRDGPGTLRQLGLEDGELLTLVLLPKASPMVAAGAFHMAAVTADGQVRCWGQDVDGSVRDIPDLPPGEHFVRVAAGGYHTLALTSSGRLLGWGQDHAQQVSGLPALHSGERFVAISAGYRHSAAVTSAGRALCWGCDSAGEVSHIPHLRWGERFVDISAGFCHTAALTSAGRALCWGGDDVPAGSVEVPSHFRAEQFVAISAGWNFTAAVTVDGRLRCWGLDSQGTVSQAPAPPPGERFVAVASSSSARHAAALTAGGALQLWGSDADGQISGMPTLEPGDAFSSVATGIRCTLATTTSGRALAWGGGMGAAGSEPPPELYG